MLKTLTIRNVVLIDKLDLDFTDGLSVFSGETGAGKSMLLDSLGLLLGQRADTALIRKGTDKLSVTGIFELKDKNNPFFAICAENDLDTEDEIIIKRSLTTDGKSKIYLNDQPITLRLLKELGSFLVEIHGQFDNQGLLNPATHLDVLDNFGTYQPQLDELKSSYKKYKETEKKLHKAQTEYEQASRDEDNLKHWISELQKADVKKGEEEDLNRRRAIAMHSEKILENFNIAYNALQGKDIAGLMQKAQSALSKINALTEDRYKNISDILDSALIELDETVSRLEQASSDFNPNNGEADQIEERLFALKALARKHQTDIDQLPDVLADFEKKLQLIDNSCNDILSLQKELEASRAEYLQQAQEVHQQRIKTARQLDQSVMNELPPLKMEKAVFMTNITTKEEQTWSDKGFDEVMFTVSTNPNSPQGALNKIASGGELARFMLALKVNLAQKSSIETLIFDEVDAGIGGATAQAVGERLSRLGQNLQVLVVTHAPQVAALGRQNYKVSKSTENDITTTTVHKLDDNEKTEEIARMLSGETITEHARATAAALINKI